MATGFRCKPAAWLSPIAKRVLERYEKQKRTNGFVLGLARNAVATEPMEGRQACNRCGLCLYGRDRLAIYDATQDLARLCSIPNFRYRAASRVIRVIPGSEHEKAVEINTAGRRELTFAKALVLAGGTLNTTALVLNSGRAIGRTFRILTNPVAALAFLVPSRLGAPLSKSGFSLGQLSYRLEIDHGHDFASGVFYSADMLPASYLAERMPLSRRAALRLSTWMSPAVLLATCYLPGRFSQNYLSLELGGGYEELHIAGEMPPETRRLLRLSTGKLSREMRRCGAYAIPRSFSVALPGADGHLAGTLPMVRQGEALTCTPECEVRPFQGVFVVDGSCLSALSAKHCTMTIMANADRVGRIVAKRLASRSLC
jgi:choline dehydrogenase-like flavoprotein